MSELLRKSVPFSEPLSCRLGKFATEIHCLIILLLQVHNGVQKTEYHYGLHN